MTEETEIKKIETAIEHGAEEVKEAVESAAEKVEHFIDEKLGLTPHPAHQPKDLETQTHIDHAMINPNYLKGSKTQPDSFTTPSGQVVFLNTVVILAFKTFAESGDDKHTAADWNEMPDAIREQCIQDEVDKLMTPAPVEISVAEGNSLTSSSQESPSDGSAQIQNSAQNQSATLSDITSTSQAPTNTQAESASTPATLGTSESSGESSGSSTGSQAGTESSESVDEGNESPDRS